MTHILVVKDKDKKICEVKITGHSGFSEKGKDIVCAAVSAIAQSTLIGLNEIAKVKLKHKIKSGDFWFEIEETNIKAETLLDTMLLSLINISEQYKNHVKVEVIND